MQSNGGLGRLDDAATEPVRTILSGPAAGVAGGYALARSSGHESVITFDMGGTSTDIAVVAGTIPESSAGEIASFPVLTPMMHIETVGAGGGSIARVDAAGALHVGPESAGADPGPASYGKSLKPTVTDANLVLGRLSPMGLLGGHISLDCARAREALSDVARRLQVSIEEAAHATIALTVSNMDRAVRRVTLQRGFDPRRFVLVAFGGAGPLHATALAGGLGIRKVLVPPHPGVLAALGLTVPDLVTDYRETVLLPLEAASWPLIDAAFERLEEPARLDDDDELFGAPRSYRYLECRYSGQSYELRVPYVDSAQAAANDFVAAHRDRYGYSSQHTDIQIVHILLRTIRPRRHQPSVVPPWPQGHASTSSRTVGFGRSTAIGSLQFVETRVLRRESLHVGTQIEGPAIVEQFDSTTIVEPGWRATVDPRFNLLLEST